MNNRSKGLLAALGAFTMWGMLPIYLKLLAAAVPLEILCHRITWSTLTTLLLVLCMKKFPSLLRAMQNRQIVLRFILTSLLLSLNWMLYIWSVNSGYIVEASLGYYINPLVNVLLGVVFLKERLRTLQWGSLFFAFLGVCYLTFGYGRFPWIAIVLAVTFGLYGLLRKTAKLPSLEGLCLETSILFLPAFCTLLYFASQGEADFLKQDINGQLLLAGTGIVTSVPLLLFGYAAQKIPLSTLGVVQYLAPTLQLSIGIFIYGEAFPREKMIGFALVWCGLLLYAAEAILTQVGRQKKRL